MTLGYITIFYALPITAGCSSLIAVNHYGLTRCLQSIGAAFWAAGLAYDEGKRVWSREYREGMSHAVRMEVR